MTRNKTITKFDWPFLFRDSSSGVSGSVTQISCCIQFSAFDVLPRTERPAEEVV